MKSRLALAFAVATALTALAAPAAAAAPAPLFRYSIDPSPDFSDLTRTANRNAYVVLQAWRLDELRSIKAANPETKVLVYKNLSFAAKGYGPGGLSSTGVSYDEASQQPGWLLKNTSGRPFTSVGYDWLYAADVGDPGYQSRWADNVMSEVLRHGWDGVFLDDVNATMKYHYDVSSVAKYPSDAAYAAATRSALAHIGPRIRGAGKLAIANNASWVEYFDTGAGWLQFLSGVMDEMFLKYATHAGEGYRDEAQWRTQLEEVKETERQGKIFIGKTQSSNADRAAARYGYATLLLGTEGRAAYSFGDHTVETPLFPEYFLSIGQPTGPERRLDSGVHRRMFSSGQVLVNPTSSAHRVPLGGSYSGSGLEGVSSVTMEPRSGLVLEEDGGDAARPPGPRPPHSLLGATAAAPRTGSVTLTWTRSRGARRYLVRRGGRRIGATRKRFFVDRRVKVGRRYRYRIVAVGRHGRRSLPSRAVRVRVRSGRVGAAIRTARPRAWRRARVLRLVRARRGRVWRQAGQLRNPARGASMRVRRHRRAVFRVVARGAGEALSARVSVRRGA